VTPASFSRRGVLVLAGVAAVSLLATFSLAVFGELLAEPPSFGADSFSRSALGHRAFVELAKAQGRTVLVSRHRTPDRAGEGALTALLEPAVGGEDDGRSRAVLRDVRDAAARLLVVLPKRSGFPDRLRSSWVGAVRYVPIEDANRVLDALSLQATAIRPPASIDAWDGTLPAPALADPQLVRSEELRPLLSCTEGMLVGELRDDRLHLVVLADPDILETHGLGRGRNAELVMAILARFDGPPVLVVDETLHGHEIQPSITRELLRFPLVLATLQALVTLGLLAWAAALRFGRPLAPAALLRPGKVFLVEHTAELLRAGGHAGEAARAYLRAAREEVLARVPPPGGAEAPDAWLARLEAARGRAGMLRRLEQRVARIQDGRRGAAVEAVRAAQQISRWREELTDGAAGDPRTRRGAQG
jgi:hypothetical protein